MNFLLILAFLFFIGSLGGWILELFYRRLFSKVNKNKKWINPGFCTGPYLPLYGNGLCLLYTIASLENHALFKSYIANKLFLFFIMAVCMTAIEYLAGIFCLNFYKVRLWDYTKEWGNIQGIICPKFSFYWSVLGAIYYFLIHPHILKALYWLSENLAFSFFIGLFFGVFIIDVATATQLIIKLKKFANEHSVVMKYEMLKYEIRQKREELDLKYQFFRPFKTDAKLHEIMLELKESFDELVKK